MKQNKNIAREYRGKLISGKTPFAVKEAYKILRTNLSFATNEEKSPVIVVSSTHAKAGKSVTSSNIAYSFSLLGKKTLLIDGDMRLPAICKIFGITEAEQGFSDLIANNARDIENYIIKSEYENLDILPSGTMLPNPSELLAFDYVRSIFDEFKKQYDVIIVDMPPANEVTDAVLLAQFVTGYILVVRSEKTKKEGIAETIDVIEKNKGKILGFVLNDLNYKSKIYGNTKYSTSKYYKKSAGAKL